MTPDRQAPPRIDRQPLRLYDMPSGRLSEEQLGGFRMGDSIEYALDFSDDGRRIATVVQHYDRRTGEWGIGAGTVWDLAHPARPIFRTPIPLYAEVALNQAGTRLYVATKGPRPVRVYDVDSGRLLAAETAVQIGADARVARVAGQLADVIDVIHHVFE